MKGTHPFDNKEIRLVSACEMETLQADAVGIHLRFEEEKK